MMQKILAMIWCLLLSSAIGVGSLLIFLFVLNQDIMPSFLLSTVTFVLSLWISNQRVKASAWHGVDLDKQERVYIQQNIRDAWRKLKMIRRLQFRIRSVIIWQKTSHLYKVARRILTIVSEQPHRFRAARSFFSTYLDSTLTILEKYTFLLSQPVRNEEMVMTLKKTESMLDDITTAMEEELIRVLSDDVLNLDVEIETLKKSLGSSSPYSIQFPEREKEKTKR
jgi:5-bromo-4-chloroindolyl phosphate hydrolysis protein